ncbi:MAG: hypothetical protein GY841_09960 [FCB group bacterium]|nr:hypothetical protein [FCB group bacterium]
MKHRMRGFIALVILGGFGLFIWSGCGGDDDNPVSGNIPKFGAVTGIVTLPHATKGEVLWAIIDDDADGEEYYAVAWTNCEDYLTYEYLFTHVPVGKYYVYAGVFIGDSDGPPEKGDLLGYYGTGRTPPNSANVIIADSDTTLCNITLEVIP